MAEIRPSIDLRNKYNEISAFCHNYDEAVYITKNGRGDLAVMSIERYEDLIGKKELLAQIDEGLNAIKRGAYSDAEAFFAELEDEAL